MKAFSWTEAAHGAIVADGKRLEAAAHGPPPGAAPTIVMLHEGLGCVALWRDFPEKLAAATGWGVFAYSRAGYGKSDPVDLPRPLDYMTREARFSLPAILGAIGFQRGILFGHSDGASIAAIYGGEHSDERVEGLVLMAPHVFTEEPGLASIAEAQARLRDRRPARETRSISRPCRQRLPGLERRVARSKLQGLEHRGIRRSLAGSGALDPGRGRPVRNRRADPRDRSADARAGREPHPRGLPSFSPPRAAAGDARRRSQVLRRDFRKGSMTMLAARIHGHGGNEVLRLDELPIPERKPGDLMIRMVAGGLNRVDLYMRNSGAGITHRLPTILGLDGAGVVEEADAGSRFRAGDPVVIYPGQPCGACEFCERGEEVLCTRGRIFGEQVDGTFAEYVAAPEGSVLGKPDRVDFAQAASLSVAWLTAWRMIATKARLKAGETALIFGVGGSVSLAATQIAAAMGARTIVTSRDAAKLERARTFGAAESIHDMGGNIVEGVMTLTGGRGVDVVIENVGKAVWPAAMRSLVRGGRLVTCGATTGDDPSADLRRLFIRQLQIFGSTLGTRAEFAEMIDFVEEKRLVPHIDAVFALADVHAALDRLESGRQFGKIGLAIGNSGP